MGSPVAADSAAKETCNADARTPSATRRAKIDFSGSKDTSKQTRSVYDGQSLGTRRRSVTFRQRSKAAPDSRCTSRALWPRAAVDAATPQQVRPSLRAAGPCGRSGPAYGGHAAAAAVPARRGGHASARPLATFGAAGPVAHCKSCACAMQQEAAAAAAAGRSAPSHAPPVVPAPPPAAAQTQPRLDIRRRVGLVLRREPGPHVHDPRWLARPPWPPRCWVSWPSVFALSLRAPPVYRAFALRSRVPAARASTPPKPAGAVERGEA